MKILQINAVNGILSTGRTTKELADELISLGEEAYIAYAFGRRENINKKNFYTYKIGSTIDRKFHALFSRITGLQGYYSYFSTKKLIAYIKKSQPDIVHLRNLHSNYIHLKCLLKFLSENDIATVITLHDCWFYTGRCSHYTKNQCYQWQSCCHKCPNNNNNMPSWFFDRSRKMYLDKKKYLTQIKRLAVIGVSHWITEEARKSFLADAMLIKPIYNWVNLDIFKPVDGKRLRKKLGLEDKFVIIGIATHWGEAKGLKDFIKLGEIFKEDSVILLVGDIKENIELGANVINIPTTQREDKLAYLYSMSDVLVSLSKEESFGKVVAEALACGTPAVVYPLTASKELVNENTGYVAANITLESIEKGIRIVKKNKKTYYSFSCRRYAAENFDMHRCIKEYIKVYKELVSASKT